MADKEAISLLHVDRRLHLRACQRRSLKGVLAVMGMISLTLFGTQAFAVEPNDPYPSGLALPAPRVDPPDLQLDDSSGEELSPDPEGAEPRPPAVTVDPKIVIIEPAEPIR
jgi:hypothetical protein